MKQRKHENLPLFIDRLRSTWQLDGYDRVLCYYLFSAKHAHVDAFHEFETKVLQHEVRLCLNKFEPSTVNFVGNIEPHVKHLPVRVLGGDMLPFMFRLLSKNVDGSQLCDTSIRDHTRLWIRGRIL